MHASPLLVSAACLRCLPPLLTRRRLRARCSFDMYDEICRYSIGFLWLLLQLWALKLWTRSKNLLERRVAMIDRLHDDFISRDEANMYAHDEPSLRSRQNTVDLDKAAAEGAQRAAATPADAPSGEKHVHWHSRRQLRAGYDTVVLARRVSSKKVAPLKNFAHLAAARGHREVEDEVGAYSRDPSAPSAQPVSSKSSDAPSPSP